MRRSLTIVRSLLAPVAGYAFIAIGTSLTFSTFGNVQHTSPPSVMIPGMIGASLSGFIGGLVAAAIAPHHRFLHAAAVLIFLVIDTTYVILNFPGPAWFDLMGSGALAVTALAGGLLFERLHIRKTAAAV